jgi:nitrous oxide reductase accessory protein NosL
MKISLWISIIIGLLLSGCSESASTTTPKHMQARFQSVPENQVHLVQKGKHREDCAICGMHLATFYKTNHIATVKKTGDKKQYCSLHCVVHDNELNKTDLLNLKVVDTNSLKFISADKAYYVVGSSKPATMSKTSKYAFGKKSDAQAFAKKYGGKIMKFYDAYDIAIKDFKK